MSGVLIRRGESGQAQGECQGVTEAEIGTVQLKTKDHQGLMALTEAEEGQGRTPPAPLQASLEAKPHSRLRPICRSSPQLGALCYCSPGKLVQNFPPLPRDRTTLTRFSADKRWVRDRWKWRGVPGGASGPPPAPSSLRESQRKQLSWVSAFSSCHL